MVGGRFSGVGYWLHRRGSIFVLEMFGDTWAWIVDSRGLVSTCIIEAYLVEV